MPDSRSCSKAGGIPGSSDPYTTLLIFTFFAFGCLFIASFGTPFIGWVYCFKVNISDVEVMTIGVFGYCWQYENSTNMCSQPTIGYDFDFFFEASPIVVPIASLPIIKAMFFHVLSFASTVIALPALVLCHFSKTSLFNWTFKITIFLGLIALTAFIIDLVFFLSVKNELAGQAKVVTGIGPWLTLTGCFLLLLGGFLFKVQSNRIIRGSRFPKIRAGPTPMAFQEQARDVEDDKIPTEGKGDINLLRQVLRNTLSHQAYGSQRLAVPNNSPNTREPEFLKHGLEACNDNIQIGDDDDVATPHPSNSTNRKLYGILVKKTMNAVNSRKLSSSLHRSPSGYAPSSYYTYRASSIMSGQTTAETFAVTRPSSGVPSTASYQGYAQDPSQQYAMELSRAPSWISTKRRSRSKKARKSMVIPVLPPLPKRPSMISTVGSFIPELPPAPPPQRMQPAYLPYGTFTIGRGQGAVDAAPPSRFSDFDE